MFLYLTDFFFINPSANVQNSFGHLSLFISKIQLCDTA